jgi:hypothetical protein
MNDKHKETKRPDHLQFIVNEGIIYGKRDMLTILRDLGYVVYYEFDGVKILGKGRGYIMKVCANSEEPTLFLAGRIYINVNILDYIKVGKVKGQDKTLFELHSGDKIIKILPDDNPRREPPLSQSLFAYKLIELGIVTDEPWDREEGGGEQMFGNGEPR